MTAKRCACVLAVVIAFMAVQGASVLVSPAGRTAVVDSPLSWSGADTGGSPQGLVPVQNMSLQVRVPPGKSFYLYFDKETETLKAMRLPDETAGLPPEAISAIDRSPNWIRDNLTRMFARLSQLVIDPTATDDFSVPAFADMNGDGAVDLVLGDSSGKLTLYKNVDPAIHYTEGYDTYINAVYVKDDTFFPPSVQSVGGFAHPAIGDLNGDNLPDIVLGGGDGKVYVFENAGPVGNPAWTAKGAVPLINVVANSAPALGDLDRDGDLDMIVGSASGMLYKSVNNGPNPRYVSDGDPATVTNAVWAPVTTVDLGIPSFSTPTLADTNGDGVLEMVVGEGGGMMSHYHVVGTSWVKDTSMLSGFTAAARSAPALVDMDADTLPDLVTGCTAGPLRYYANVGTGAAAKFMLWQNYTMNFDQVNFNQYYWDANHVYLTHRSATQRLIDYSRIINTAPQKMVDEVAFSIANANAASLLNPAAFPEVYLNNTDSLYFNSQFTSYAQIMDYGLGTPDQWSTVRYLMNDSGNMVWYEYPRDIYYWWLVSPKGTDEMATFINPTMMYDGHQGARNQSNGGVFWRWAAFNLASPSWPADVGARGYPKEEPPPVLSTKIVNATVLWNNQTYSMGSIYDGSGWFTRSGGANALVASKELGRVIGLTDTESLYSGTITQADNMDLATNMIKWLAGQDYWHDIVVAGVQAPSYMDASDSVRVNATVRNEGIYDEIGVIVNLTVDGGTANSTTITALNSGDYVEVSFLWSPLAERQHNICIVAQAVPSENITTNNAECVWVNVRNRKGTVRFDQTHGSDSISLFGMLVESLLADGYSVDVWNGPTLNSSSFVGAGVFVVPQAKTAYLPSELSDVQNFTSAGGGLFVLGDSSPAVCNALTSFGDIDWESGGSGGISTNITPHETTLGVTSVFLKNPTAILTLGTNATSLVRDGTGGHVAALAEVPGRIAGFVDAESLYDASIVREGNMQLVENIVAWLMSTAQWHDIAIGGLESPSYSQPGNVLQVNATVRNNGILDESSIVVNLTADDMVVDSATIPLLQSNTSMSVSFSWTPTEEGLVGICAEAQRVSDENVTTNNAACSGINVRAMKGAVLFDQTHGADNMTLISEWTDRLAYEGFTVAPLYRTPLDSAALSGVDVLVIPQARTGYLQTETSAIQDFLRSGGGLLVSGDAKLEVYSSLTGFAGFYWIYGGLGGKTTDVTPHDITIGVSEVLLPAPKAELVPVASALSVLKDAGGHVVRPWNATDQAVEIVDHWVASTVPLNAQAGGDANRPRQPVRIQWEHNGNCGEISDMLWAGLRSALIPARGICGYGGDHCWGEFYERGWHQIDDYWDASTSIIANNDNYHYGWNRDWSGLMTMRGDGMAVDVVSNYHKTWDASDDTSFTPENEGLIDRANVTVVVVDAFGNPLDGVKVGLGDYRFLSPSWQSFGTQWTFTDAEGKAYLTTSEARQNNNPSNPSASDTFDDGIAIFVVSKMGTAALGDNYVDRAKPSYGDVYNPRNAPMNYYNFSLGGRLPRPMLPMSEVPPSPGGIYTLNVSFSVEWAAQHPAVGARWNEGLAYHELELSTGRRVTSFFAGEADFRKFMQWRQFDASDASHNVTGADLSLGIPPGQDWYYVISNPGTLETTQVVKVSATLLKPPPEQRTFTVTPAMVGKHLMSIPLRPVDTDIGSVLGGILGSVGYVRWFDSSDAVTPWKSYAPGRAQNSLLQLDETVGFWIEFTGPCTWTITGFPANSTSIMLRSGWNLVGYPSSSATYTVGDLKADVGLAGVKVESFDDKSPPYDLWVLPDTYALKTNEGYWIYVPQDCIWLVSW